MNTKLPSEEFFKSKIKIKEIGEKNNFLREYENGIFVSHDFLGMSNSNYVNQFFIRYKQNSVDICYLSQSYFGLAKKLYEKIVPN